MRRLIATASLLAGLGAVVAPARAANLDYQIETIHTHALFNVMHLGFARMWGVFPDITGTIGIDVDNIATCTVDITIKTATIDTQFVDRNKDMRGADWFNVAEFPDIRYVAKSCTKTGDKSGVVHGELTLHGVTKPVDANVILNKLDENPMDRKSEAGLTATATIKRVDFGMTALGPTMGFPIGNEVNIIMDVEAKR
jgi:polyisoprenoid-binding protein YceI